MTLMVRVTEADCPVLLVAVTTCCAGGQVTVGVPVIAPVELEIARPEGSAGLIAKLAEFVAVGAPELKACVRTATSELEE